MTLSSTRIQQVCMSEVFSDLWGSAVRKRYGLTPYTSPDHPALFFGCYPPKRHRSGRVRKDVRRIERHRSLAVVAWCGGDSRAATTSAARCYYRDILHRPNVAHIAISRSVAEDLQLLGVPYVHVPLCTVSTGLYYPVPLGPKVYVYTSFAAPAVYGWPIVEEVRRRLPRVKFAIHASSAPHCISREQLQKVYEKCFIGLRPTPHDGLSNTVVELGLMGRRCIWNGWTPDAIPWTSVEGIVKAIKKERARVGSTYPKISERMASYINVGEDWLRASFYKWSPGKIIVKPNVSKRKIERSQQKRVKKLAEQKRKLQKLASYKSRLRKK